MVFNIKCSCGIVARGLGVPGPVETSVKTICPSCLRIVRVRNINEIIGIDWMISIASKDDPSGRADRFRTMLNTWRSRKNAYVKTSPPS